MQTPIPRIYTESGSLPPGATSPAILYAMQSRVKWHLRKANLPERVYLPCRILLETMTSNKQLQQYYALCLAGNAQQAINNLMQRIKGLRKLFPEAINAIKHYEKTTKAISKAA